MWGWVKKAWKGIKKVVKTVVNKVVRPVINVVLWPARQLVKGSIWVLVGFLTRTKGTDRIKSRNIDLNSQIQSFKCYKCFIGNSIGAGIGSVFTKIVSNQMIMHWWAEIQTTDGKYYICQFNHPHKATRNVCELIYCSSSSVVAKRGRNSAGNKANCRVYHDNDFDIICDSLLSVATLKDVWDFMHSTKWNIYDLFYINCQHFVKGLYKYIKKIVGKKHCTDSLINIFTITTVIEEEKKPQRKKKHAFNSNQCSKNIKISANGKNIQTIKSSWTSTFGNQWIESTNAAIYQWVFKVDTKKDHYIGLGITSSDQLCDTTYHSDAKNPNYSYHSDGSKFSNGGSGEEYGTGFQQNSIIKMILNLNKGSLSFITDGKEEGIAFSNVLKRDDIKYKMAVYLYREGDSITLESFTVF